MITMSKRCADRLVTKIDTGVIAMASELRAHERQAAEELASCERPARQRNEYPAGGRRTGSSATKTSASKRQLSNAVKCSDLHRASLLLAFSDVSWNQCFGLQNHQVVLPQTKNHDRIARTPITIPAESPPRSDPQP
jgi:hypothetical protein